MSKKNNENVQKCSHHHHPLTRPGLKRHIHTYCTNAAQSSVFNNVIPPVQKSAGLPDREIQISLDQEQQLLHHDHEHWGPRAVCSCPLLFRMTQNRTAVPSLNHIFKFADDMIVE